MRPRRQRAAGAALSALLNALVGRLSKSTHILLGLGTPGTWPTRGRSWGEPVRASCETAIESNTSTARSPVWDLTTEACGGAWNTRRSLSTPARAVVTWSIDPSGRFAGVAAGAYA